MQRLRPLLLAAAVLLAAGCRDSDPTSARAPQATARDIQLALESDSTPPPPAPARPASFLPPLARPASFPGVFDPSLAPVVEVCAAADEACASPVARFTTGGSGAAAVRADSAAGQYSVNWSTAAS